MLSVIMLNVNTLSIILSVTVPSVKMPNVVTLFVIILKVVATVKVAKWNSKLNLPFRPL